MRRRTVLAAAGTSLATLGGCLGSAHDTSDPTTESTPEETATTPPGVTDRSTESTPEETTSVPLDVSVDALQRGTIWLTSPDSSNVRGADSRHLLLEVARPSSVPVSDTPALEDFSLRFDGSEYRPTQLDETYGLYRVRIGGDDAYADGSGLLLFEVPASVGADNAAVSWPGGEWTAPEPTRSRLATPEPPLSVDVSIPETVTVGEPVPIDVQVTNEGDTETRFVAAVDRSGPYIAHITAQQLRVSVPPGETVTRTLEDGFVQSPREDEVGDGESDATYYVDWAEGRTEATVRVVEG